MSETNEAKKRTVWVSKYALTDGIKEADAFRVEEQSKWLSVKGYWVALKLGRDAHQTLGEAQAAAEKMRDKKIRSLETQIAKLKAMKF